MYKIHVMSISLYPAIDLHSASALSQPHVSWNIQGLINDNILVLSSLEYFPPESVHFSSSSTLTLGKVLPLFGAAPHHLVKLPKIPLRWLHGESCLQTGLKTWVLALGPTWRKERTNFCELFFSFHTCVVACGSTQRNEQTIKYIQ